MISHITEKNYDYKSHLNKILYMIKCDQHPDKVGVQTFLFGQKYLPIIPRLVQEGNYLKAFEEADEFEKLFIDVLLYAAQKSKKPALLFVKKSIGLMIEFEMGDDQLQFDIFSHKQDFKTKEYGTNETTMNKIISFILECRNNKAVIYYLTNDTAFVDNQKEKAMSLLMEVTSIRIQLLPTLEDYFQLGLIYLNIGNTEPKNKSEINHRLEFITHSIEIFENIYQDTEYNKNYLCQCGYRKNDIHNKYEIFTKLIDDHINFLQIQPNTISIPDYITENEDTCIQGYLFKVTKKQVNFTYNQDCIYLLTKLFYVQRIKELQEIKAKEKIYQELVNDIQTKQELRQVKSWFKERGIIYQDKNLKLYKNAAKPLESKQLIKDQTKKLDKLNKKQKKLDKKRCSNFSNILKIGKVQEENTIISQDGNSVIDQDTFNQFNQYKIKDSDLAIMDKEKLIFKKSMQDFYNKTLFYCLAKIFDQRKLNCLQIVVKNKLKDLTLQAFIDNEIFTEFAKQVKEGLISVSQDKRKDFKKYLFDTQNIYCLMLLIVKNRLIRRFKIKNHKLLILNMNYYESQSEVLQAKGAYQI